MNKKKVYNPLTIVGIFCSLAEIFAISVLPKLDISLQRIFLWFVILFPVLLLTAFFLTLNFNSTVLYAPSDFQSDEAYLEQLRLIKLQINKNIQDSIDSQSKEVTVNDFMKVVDDTFAEVSQKFSMETRLLSAVVNAGDKGIGKRELAEKCEVSPFTVDRALKQLIASNLVRKVGHVYVHNLGDCYEQDQD